MGRDLLAAGVPDELYDALALVVSERVKQDAQWGLQDHHPLMWLAVLGEEVGEAHQAGLEAVLALSKNNRARAAELHELLEYELVQVAAVAVNALARLRRGRLGSSDGEAWSAPLVSFHNEVKRDA